MTRLSNDGGNWSLELSFSFRETGYNEGDAEWRALRGLGACHFAYRNFELRISNFEFGSAFLCVLVQLTAVAQELKTVSPADVQNRIAQVRSSTGNTVDPQALELGRSLIKSGRFVEAAALFDVLVEKQPRDYTVLYFAALATFNAGRPSQAEPMARRALDAAVAPHKQSAADALVLLAVILAVTNKDAEALKAAEQAVQIAPNSFDAQFVLGRARYGAGDYDSAVKAFRLAVALKPTDADAQFFLATTLERSGDDAAALAAYKELVLRNPRRVEGHLGVGVLLVKKGGAALDEGVRELRAAIVINPRLYEARVTLGRTLVSVGRNVEALEHLKVAAELAPNNPEPHYQLSRAYRRLGRTEDAAREAAIVKQIHESRRGIPAVRMPQMTN